MLGSKEKSKLHFIKWQELVLRITFLPIIFCIQIYSKVNKQVQIKEGNNYLRTITAQKKFQNKLA